jgi:hypothetical protein
MKSTASHQVTCDHCGQKLGEYSHDSSKGHISVSLSDESKYSNENSVNKEPFDGKGYNSKQVHACGESCLAGILDKRAKGRAKAKKTARASELDTKAGILTLDMSIK